MQRSFNCFYVRVTTRGGYLYLHFLWGTGLSFLYCWMQLMGEAVLVLWLQVFFMFACLPTTILSCITHFILTYCLCFGFFFPSLKSSHFEVCCFRKSQAIFCKNQMSFNSLTMYFLMYYKDIHKILWAGQFSLEVLDLFFFLVSQSWNLPFFRPWKFYFLRLFREEVI